MGNVSKFTYYFYIEPTNVIPPASCGHKTDDVQAPDLGTNLYKDYEEYTAALLSLTQQELPLRRPNDACTVYRPMAK
jgi:hypothetical protein